MKSTLYALALSIAMVFIVSSETGIAFARTSNSIAFILQEPLADSPSPEEYIPPTPDYGPPADSAESPAPDNSPSDASAESPIPDSSIPLRYYDLTLYGAVSMRSQIETL
ncbi:hypothetical protein RIF29_41231 [Crotalaria pallida]|uniref:Uncharacterized protein n=1 Tax=Crotalaria pallida TaxID=3830 RepID=A0AAN9E4N1_CROPI